MLSSVDIAERTALTTRMVPGTQVKPSWTNLHRVHGMLSTYELKQFVPKTTGVFAGGWHFIAFEKAEDALVYRIMFPE